MGSLRWTPDRMEQLEHATRVGRRVTLMRRGTEFVVVARRIVRHGSGEALIGYLPMTGEELRFDLEDIDAFQVIT